MKAIKLAEPWQVACVELDKPTPKPGEALIKVVAAGICGSDIGAFRGTNGLVSYPRVIGHELAGIVESIPENKKGIRPGDRVVVDPYLYCGHCYPCRIGRTNCCTDLKVLGVHVDGGMAEYYCHPADMLIKIPDGMTWEEAAMAEPLTISLHGIHRGGLKAGEMFVLAARPSIGKTAIALNIVRNIMMKDIGGKRRTVAFFSLEMSAEQVAQRLLCTESRVPISSIMDRNLKPGDSSRLSAAAIALKNARLYIDPTAGISVFELRAKARKLHDLHKLDLIVIDYLQLMKSGDAAGKDSRQVEVAAISGGLKKLAKDLGLPVLVLAQLNREVEKGAGPANPKPKLSHLRESGAIEQDADVVVFLHRNRDDTKESNPEANKVGVDAELIVEKNRNGKTGVVKLKFFPALMEFRSMEHRYGDSDVPAANSPK